MMSFIKNLSVWEMKNKAEHKHKNAEREQNTKVSCLKQDSKMNKFCLKQGQGLKALAAHPTQTPLKCSPPRAVYMEGGLVQGEV